MPTSVSCPDERALQEYLLGRTSEPEARGLEEHVSACAACALKLNGLAERDSLAQPLPSFARPLQIGGEVEALIGRLCDRTQAAGHAATVPVAEVLGDFRILREIGRGGMGIVYVAEQISLGRKVALKVLPFAAALDQKQLQRFKNEAQAAAQLHHTNIVPVHYVGCERGVHFYAMQFIEGQSLAGVLDELRQLAGRQGNEKKNTLSQVAQDMLIGRSPLAQSPAAAPTTPSPCLPPYEEKHKTGEGTVVDTPPPGPISSQQSFPSPAYFRTVARLGVQAAEALEHAHQTGVVHRDIKPANLLVDVHANLWITDFGLAHCQASAGLTMTGDLLGTLRYMSPEQALANRVVIDHRTDIYSLGASLYEMLTLEPAFAGSDRQELLRQIAFEEPRPPRRLTRAIPAELETIVLKALEKNPLDRYSTARELADDLQRVLDDQPIRARRPSTLQRARKWGRRHEGVVATFIGGLFVAVLILAVSSWLIMESLNRARQAEQDATAKLGRALRAEEEANNNLEKTKQAEREKTEELGKARLAQAQAGRWSGRAGRVFDSLRALTEAAQIARSLKAPDEYMLKLRNEAIACMALTDLRPIKEWEKYTPDSPGAALDPRSERYTASDAQGNISIRRMADGREILHLNGPGTSVGSVAFSPDGEFLEAIYAPDAKTKRSLIRIWDLRRGEIAFRLTPDFPGPVVVWSLDSRRFAVYGHAGIQGQTGTIAVYEVLSFKEIKRFPVDRRPHQIAFHPNGKQIAVLRAGAVQIREVETGNLVSQFAFPARVLRLSWGGDGRFLAGAGNISLSREYWDVYLWDVPAGEMRVLKGHVNTVIDVAFNHAGDLLASTSWDGTHRLWNPWTGKELVRTEGFWGRPLEFSPDDRFLSIAVGWSNARRWWQVKTSREHRTHYSPLATTVGTGYVEFSPGGRLLASAGRNGIRLWDVAAVRQIAFVPGQHTVRFEPDGKNLLTAGSSGIHRWPLALDQDEFRRKLRVGPPQKFIGGSIGLEDVSRDGETLLALVLCHSLIVGLPRSANCGCLAGSCSLEPDN